MRETTIYTPDTIWHSCGYKAAGITLWEIYWMVPHEFSALLMPNQWVRSLANHIITTAVPDVPSSYLSTKYSSVHRNVQIYPGQWFKLIAVVWLYQLTSLHWKRSSLEIRRFHTICSQALRLHNAYGSSLEFPHEVHNSSFFEVTFSEQLQNNWCRTCFRLLLTKHRLIRVN